MPYNNRYNRRIADEYDSINERYVKHIGENYPMEGGSLDTGFDTQRVVGGARGVDEYVRNVLEGTYMVPTQAMPSSSMSGLGYSAGMRKYKGAGVSGGYRISKKMPVREAVAVARAKFEIRRSKKPNKTNKNFELLDKKVLSEKVKNHRGSGVSGGYRISKKMPEEEARAQARRRFEDRKFNKLSVADLPFQPESEPKRIRRPKILKNLPLVLAPEILDKRVQSRLNRKPRKLSAWNKHWQMVAAELPKGTSFREISNIASDSYNK
jgi:hypothetical protein